jgi:hypothetical protein
MTTSYSVTNSDDDDRGEPANRFATRAEADARFQQMRAAGGGKLVRIVRWQNNYCMEVARAEPKQAP